MEINFLIIFIASLVPLVMGFIWYNPKVFGKAWMAATGITEESAKKANMPLIFGLTLLFSFMLAMIMQSLVIHQFGVFSLLSHQPDFANADSEPSILFKRIMELYGNSYRTFKHGAFHGTLAGIFVALPILGTNALFERKGIKYITINCGYWAVSMGLMGGIICAFP